MRIKTHIFLYIYGCCHLCSMANMRMHIAFALFYAHFVSVHIGCVFCYAKDSNTWIYEWYPVCRAALFALCELRRRKKKRIMQIKKKNMQAYIQTHTHARTNRLTAIKRNRDKKKNKVWWSKRRRECYDIPFITLAYIHEPPST